MTDQPAGRFEVDPELKGIWKKYGEPKFFFPRVEDMAGSRRLHAMGNTRFMKSAFVKETLGNTSPPPWTEEDRPIVVRDGSSIKVRIYRPRENSTGRPVMVVAHSGGWCLGGLETEEFICQLLCLRLNMVVVNVAYRLSPDVSYPTHVFDVYDTIKWVAVNAQSIGGELSKGFLTCGVSAGGNLTNMCSILARDEGLRPNLTGHVYICTGFPHDYRDQNGNISQLFPEQFQSPSGSWEMYKDGPVANRAMNGFYADLAKCDASSPLFSPFTQKDFSGLGPVYFQVAGMDLWKDTSPFYCDLIEQAGGRTKIDVYPGVPHLWYSIYPQLSINKKWARDLVDGVEWLLKQKSEAQISSRL
ncbi:Alpha/Beta hydrolase protein [Exophiala viscosa]|uniref:Alpha/Beta hydrolase protein n=1 Tax=Exophiala viscosa TaxID=2486360 RepID=UPI00218EC02F|nr:Alpha/Beta hydrolase protein [Exophiala viscosa]